MVEIARIERAIARWGERFLRRVYTETELERWRNRPASLAARFAAKEAVMKALGTGARGVGWQDIEILASPGGEPVVCLKGRARRQARRLNLGGLAVSLAHSREYALATVVGDRDESRNR